MKCPMGDERLIQLYLSHCHRVIAGGWDEVAFFLYGDDPARFHTNRRASSIIGSKYHAELLAMLTSLWIENPNCMPTKRNFDLLAHLLLTLKQGYSLSENAKYTDLPNNWATTALELSINPAYKTACNQFYKASQKFNLTISYNARILKLIFSEDEETFKFELNSLNDLADASRQHYRGSAVTSLKELSQAMSIQIQKNNGQPLVATEIANKKNAIDNLLQTIDYQVRSQVSTVAKVTSNPSSIFANRNPLPANPTTPMNPPQPPR